jgi:chromosome segregation protein
VYLKTLEMVGFKSFAEKTRLAFEPGMIAIVGPNGCGKSNVSDAIRWVLGEQSAKALRGSRMEDCIFNGTQNRKPLGMAEVSITFADCEKTLTTEFNEVTITRRVFRSGEGQYFINKKGCRLRDVQRLFMDTGIGTSSYSFMAQGRIDQILSSRPEDRRSIFEEASGITKFKADKREAIRKLEHTEANLLRLADVIREVKRQIGSLQRQAGKARRYKTLRDELKGLDLFASRSRLHDDNRLLSALRDKIAGLNRQASTAHDDVEVFEKHNEQSRAEIAEVEREINRIVEAGMQAQSQLDRARDLIQINRQRIEEYENWTERDSREVDQITEQIEARLITEAELTTQLTQVDIQWSEADRVLKEAAGRFAAHQTETDSSRQRVQKLREESVEIEGLVSRLQNQLIDIENRERATMIQREKLLAEKTRLEQAVQQGAARVSRVQQAIATQTGEVDALAKTLAEHEEARQQAEQGAKALQQQRGEIHSRIAGAQARVDLLTDSREAEADFPAGARMLLDPDTELTIQRELIMGPLANGLSFDDDYTAAIQVALRAQLDAVVVRDGATAEQVMTQLSERRGGAARLLRLDATASSTTTLPAPALLDHVTCPDDWRPLLTGLLGHVGVVETPADIPANLAPYQIVVTKTGVLVAGDGRVELWSQEGVAGNPLARQHAIEQTEEAIATDQTKLADVEVALTGAAERTAALQEAIATTRRALEEKRRALAHHEGECHTVADEAKQTQQRFETVTTELDELVKNTTSWEDERAATVGKQADVRARREELTVAIGAQARDLQEMETRNQVIQSELTEKRIAAAGFQQSKEHLLSQHGAVVTRLQELKTALQGRTQGLENYQANIVKLQEAILQAESQTEDLSAATTSHAARAEEKRTIRNTQAAAMADEESKLAAKRTELEKVVEQRSKLEVKSAEEGMRHQNMVDRVTSDYAMSLDEVMEHQDPEWEEGAPAIEQAETRVADLRSKLEAMGPVNLVAIEEYQELEERYVFLTTQEADLTSAKSQLLDMIREINKTTSELFRSTFEQANANFQAMFTQLFNGGNAKLVLVNEEDVLECGIEIIARPPGKRLQNVTLLSGGERTMTAVALLFAIYMIKPSPFCLLDELDAPLDDSNIGRFCRVVQGFTKNSQFVIITHNRQTIAVSDVIYGVTMPERGVSRIVSMKFRNAKGGVMTTADDAAPAESAIAPPPPRRRKQQSKPSATNPTDQTDPTDPTELSDAATNTEPQQEN